MDSSKSTVGGRLKKRLLNPMKKQQVLFKNLHWSTALLKISFFKGGNGEVTLSGTSNITGGVTGGGNSKNTARARWGL